MTFNIMNKGTSLRPFSPCTYLCYGQAFISTWSTRTRESLLSLIFPLVGLSLTLLCHSLTPLRFVITNSGEVNPSLSMFQSLVPTLPQASLPESLSFQPHIRHSLSLLLYSLLHQKEDMNPSYTLIPLPPLLNTAVCHPFSTLL